VLTQANSKLADLIAEQEAIFIKRQPSSAALADRAKGVLAGGVTSSWQITQPQPVWLSHGSGGKVYDADGNEYVDHLHGGYGAALAGHAHPVIARAVKAQVERGTHFAQPTENAIVVGDELARRWGLPRWRFANSGTEATMDAVHLMRSYTGRDLIIKVGRLPRASRLGPGLGHAGRGRSRPEGPSGQRTLLGRHPPGHHRPHAGRPVQ
jgi:glutamate-1-semialdehyde 2,1-aminomutase